MIQSQINRNIRLDLADAILLSKAKRSLICRDCRRYRSGRSLRNRGFAGAASASCRRRPPGRGEAGSRRRRHSTVADDSLRGCIDDRIPTDPTMYRFYEMLQVYGTTLKALVHEKFGDGIISAINFKLDVKKVADPEGGERAVITLDGKYLPTKPF